ncbi:MAG TPA: glycosyltransferase family 4 protein, partial [Pseudidiomarina sp.]|nr:glycosyltransferase family 4 protein [Pseudidiomarina sp.]
RVTFVGWVDYDDKITLLRQCDVFCLPSRYDSFGMGFIEAMAAGLPVVAYDLPAIRSVVQHERTGYLLSTLTAEHVATALQQAYEHKLRLGSHGKEHVRQEFTAEQAVLRLLTVLGT